MHSSGKCLDRPRLCSARRHITIADLNRTARSFAFCGIAVLSSLPPAFGRSITERFQRRSGKHISGASVILTPLLASYNNSSLKTTTQDYKLLVLPSRSAFLRCQTAQFWTLHCNKIMPMASCDGWITSSGLLLWCGSLSSGYGDSRPPRQILDGWPSSGG